MAEAKILEGKTLSLKILEELKKESAYLPKKLVLAIVQIGKKAESNLYIEKKKEFGEKAGFEVRHLELAESIGQKDVIEEIKKLNKDSGINGIIVQLPLPPRLSFFEIIESVAPSKDVDGLHSLNLKKLMEGNDTGLVPATARAVLSILDFYKIQISGKKVTVVGRSILAGKPIALLFLNRDATVTICHRQTLNLKELARSSDILISAMGSPLAVSEEFVSVGQVVIDVGISAASGEKMEEEASKRKIVGDVQFEKVKNIVSAISPVPGGVGPMTVASLFQNLLKAYRLQESKSVSPARLQN